MPNKLLAINLKYVLDQLFETTGDDKYSVSHSELQGYSDRELRSLYKQFSRELEDYDNEPIVIYECYRGPLRNIDSRQNSFYRTSRFN